MDIYEAGTVPTYPNHKYVNRKIALLYAGDLEKHKFMETVASSRGYGNARVFNNYEQAVAWLKVTNK